MKTQKVDEAWKRRHAGQPNACDIHHGVPASICECNDKPRHTPTPLKMAYEYDGTPITEAMLHEKLGISLDHAERIIRAVNSHEELVAKLAICVHTVGSHMTPAFRESIEKCLKDILKSEGK